MENREPQNRFLQPIQDSDRHGASNPRKFLKAKVIQASSQLNTDRDKIFQFLDNHQIWISVKLILRNNLGLECTIILFRS